MAAEVPEIPTTLPDLPRGADEPPPTATTPHDPLTLDALKGPEAQPATSDIGIIPPPIPEGVTLPSVCVLPGGSEHFVQSTVDHAVDLLTTANNIVDLLPSGVKDGDAFGAISGWWDSSGSNLVAEASRCSGSLVDVVTFCPPYPRNHPYHQVTMYLQALTDCLTRLTEWCEAVVEPFLLSYVTAATSEPPTPATPTPEGDGFDVPPPQPPSAASGPEDEPPATLPLSAGGSKYSALLVAYLDYMNRLAAERFEVVDTFNVGPHGSEHAPPPTELEKRMRAGEVPETVEEYEWVVHDCIRRLQRIRAKEDPNLSFFQFELTEIQTKLKKILDGLPEPVPGESSPVPPAPPSATAPPPGAEESLEDVSLGDDGAVPQQRTFSRQDVGKLRYLVNFIDLFLGSMDPVARDLQLEVARARKEVDRFEREFFQLLAEASDPSTPAPSFFTRSTAAKLSALRKRVGQQRVRNTRRVEELGQSEDGTKSEALVTAFEQIGTLFTHLMENIFDAERGFHPVEVVVPPPLNDAGQVVAPPRADPPEPVSKRFTLGRRESGKADWRQAMVEQTKKRQEDDESGL